MKNLELNGCTIKIYIFAAIIVNLLTET